MGAHGLRKGRLHPAATGITLLKGQALLLATSSLQDLISWLGLQLQEANPAFAVRTVALAGTVLTVGMPKAHVNGRLLLVLMRHPLHRGGPLRAVNLLSVPSDLEVAHIK